MPGEVLEGPLLPKARMPKGRGNLAIKAIGIELAALAWVAMENGVYRGGKDYRQQYDKERRPIPNKCECMRLAGYADASVTGFDAKLGKKQEFWQLVELHRIRRTDPAFAKAEEDQILGRIVGHLTENILETVRYAPHTISFRDNVMALKTFVDLGFRMGPEAAKSGRASELLGKLDPEDRRKAIQGIEKDLQAKLKDVESLSKAYEAADRE